MSTKNKPKPNTIAELKASGYQPKTIKQELRENLLLSLQSGNTVFENIHGYEETVIPDIERAILSGHNINLLGLRGQAKTRIARSMVNLLDEWIPVIEGSEINDDPFNPVSHFARQKVKELWVMKHLLFGYIATNDLLKSWPRLMFRSRFNWRYRSC
jgi:magnesium chelatase subunit I